ncbi:MAG TPA: DNA integrity scanning protein DisA nucleotide-binding domain protein [Firmicutes bacterium]|nr:DNA integrity scanning protein DisA nucleotide-binding domain protein [Bacillota bacterium]
MRSPQEVGEGIKAVFTNFSQNWIIVIEAVFLFLLIYFVLKILYENNAKKLIPVYVFLLVCTGAVTLFSEHLTVVVYYVFIMLMSLFFLLLFSVEIKRSIWNVAAKRVGSVAGAQAAKNNAVSARADEYISGIVKAVQNLSKNNTGALIVLSNGNLPKEIIDSGVTLNANISNQLIEGIFIPKAPLHDGAMIIYGDKIQAAGCFLPLTQKDFPKDYGTRHRAGIGVTEVADVSTIIVSEETGIVSYVRRGEITRYVDSESLKRYLKDYYWKEFNSGGKKA